MYAHIYRRGRASSIPNVLALGLTLGWLLQFAVPALAQTATWTYQGSLRDGDVLANGTYDFRFELYDDPFAGAQVGPTVNQDDIDVAEGLFTVLLDFGDQFNGDDVWLEIAVRPGDSGEEPTVLSPRQWLTPVPYASGLILPYDGSGANSNPLAVFSVANTSSGFGVRGQHDASGNFGALGGLTDGVFGRGSGGGTSGVWGENDAGGNWGFLGGSLYGVAGGDVSSNNLGHLGSDQAGVYGIGDASRAGLFEITDSLNNSPALEVTTNANGGAYPEGIALLAQATGTGDTYGVWAETDSSTGFGVLGKASSAGENTIGIGVRGESAGELGVGVFGASTWTATREGFPNYGVCGVAESATSGEASAGVYGLNNGTEPIVGEFPPIRYGVYGRTLGYGYGVYGTTADVGGVGVKGKGPTTGVSGLADNASGITYGVEGVSDSTSGRGVYGQTTAASGYTYGVYGESASPSGRGVIGKATDPSGATRGVYGLSDSTSGTGLYGYAYADSGETYGVYGRANSEAGYGVYSAGDFGGSGAKYFVQPHPSDPSKEIHFVCLEGNESGTYFRGSARLGDGRTVIEVPEEFRLVTEPEGLTVQLTAMGPDAGLWVESKSLDRIIIRGSGEVEFDYFVNGIRRGYRDLELIRDNHAYVPELRGVPYGTQYTEGHRRILIENGILNPDFTPSEETAARMGWTLKDPEPDESAGIGIEPGTEVPVGSQ